ncbi:hypothetical protein NE237_017219 [Protea cynaroides]|uniref:Uncharacterized protein n=1 Tax=Protea cynaroides TaxID=273540 RepID=A0A9Q0QMP8_9MAGN|nr:hypothetical protein NE237_017219 [Protea cynaroides]
MGMTANLVTYSTGRLHLPSTTTANIITKFSDFVADTYLGRYWIISISILIEALVIPSLSGFGTNQFEDKDEKEKSTMDYFFSRFYFVISIGTFLGVTVEIYIQDYVSFTWGYGICCFIFCFGLIVYWSQTRKYRYKKCMGSPIVQILQVLKAALGKRKFKSPSIDTLYEETPETARIHHTDQLHWLDKAAIIDRDDYQIDGSVIQNPWKLCPLTKVEEVKMVVRLLPIWASTIFFWNIRAQLLTFFVEQASTMERSIGSFQIPGDSFNTFYIFGILIASVFYDRMIIRLMKKWKGKHGTISIGIAFSIVAMVIATFTDTKRINVVNSMGGNLTTLPISCFNGTAWLTNNISYGKLYHFYALLTLLSSINFIFFVLCVIWYARTTKNGVQMESIVSSLDEEEKYAMEMESTLTASAKKDRE